MMPSGGRGPNTSKPLYHGNALLLGRFCVTAVTVDCGLSLWMVCTVCVPGMSDNMLSMHRTNIIADGAAVVTLASIVHPSTVPIGSVAPFDDD